MHRALPGSEYYGGSAPPPTDRPTTNPAQPAAPECAAAGRPRAVPVFTVIRSSKEEPDSAPAASLRVRRRPSPQPPGRRLHDSQRVPHHHGGGCAPLPALIHQVRAGKALRGVKTSVPRVLLSDLLTGPTPSGGTGAPRLCQDCSHPTPASPGPGCPQLLPDRCDGPAAKVSHLHSNQQRLTAHEARAERLRDHLRRTIRENHSLKPPDPTHRLSDRPGERGGSGFGWQVVPDDQAVVAENGWAWRGCAQRSMRRSARVRTGSRSSTSPRMTPHIGWGWQRRGGAVRGGHTGASVPVTQKSAAADQGLNVGSGMGHAPMRIIFDQPDAEQVAAPFDRVVARLEERLPAVAEHLAAARDDLSPVAGPPGPEPWRREWLMPDGNDPPTTAPWCLDTLDRAAHSAAGETARDTEPPTCARRRAVQHNVAGYVRLAAVASHGIPLPVRRAMPPQRGSDRPSSCAPGLGVCP